MICEKCKKEKKDLVKVQHIFESGTKLYYGEREFYCEACWKQLKGE